MRGFENRTGISYVYNPMLILVEVNKAVAYGQIEYQDKLVIDLDDGTSPGIRRSGVLFEAIFDIAKQEVRLDRFGKEIRMCYLKGNAVKTIASILDGSLIEPLTDTIEGILKYRIK